MKDYEVLGSRSGGELSEYLKPWILEYGRKESKPRSVKIYSNVWGVAQLGNGHHHADITEENNSILIKDKEGLWWGRPWRWDEDEEMTNALRGRSERNDDFIYKKDVVKWAVGLLKEWGVLGNKQYKIQWDLCDDDPYASQSVADEMRNNLFKELDPNDLPPERRILKTPRRIK
jgi:hypothetical protein